MAPTLTGQLVVILTVTDAEQSATWYEALLGAHEQRRYGETEGRCKWSSAFRVLAWSFVS